MTLNGGAEINLDADCESTRAVDSPPGSVPRAGRWVELVPVTPQYLDFLYRLATDEHTGFRWRYMGSVPNPETFRQTLWNGVLAQFVVIEKHSSTPLGTTIAYNADLNHGYAYIGGTSVNGIQSTGIAIEAFHLFAKHLFAVWNLRKLYLEVPEYNIRPMANAVGRLFKEEGNLRSHLYYDGRFWDRRILALYREEFGAHSRRGLRARNDSDHLIGMDL